MKSFIALFVGALAFTGSMKAMAADLQVDLKTPRGSFVKLDIYNPGLKAVLVMAPGQGCGARLDMYDAIAAEAKRKGFTVVRLYWAYCVADPEKGNPSEDLSTEREDLLATLGFVRGQLKHADETIYIGGKSLGSFVSFEVFRVEKSLRGLVLLTPVCTDSRTDPKNHKNMFAEYYPGLASEVRQVLLAQGNTDPLCESPHFLEFLKGAGTNFMPLIVSGNHGFGIQNPDGTYNAELGAKNLRVISSWIFTWIGSGSL